jgi:hypothetical protein
MSRSDFNNDEHFVVSYELLKLLQWLLIHEQDALKKLIMSALAQGLKYELSGVPDDAATTAMDQANPESIEDLQENILDFFTLLEVILHETMTEQHANTHIQKTMIPAINHIDTSTCDMTSVALSVEKATAAVVNKTGENPKDVLCKELLKRWKPTKKPYAH